MIYQALKTFHIVISKVNVRIPSKYPSKYWGSTKYFDAIKKIFLAMNMVFAAYIITAFFSKPDWGALLSFSILTSCRNVEAAGNSFFLSSCKSLYTSLKLMKWKTHEKFDTTRFFVCGQRCQTVQSFWQNRWVTGHDAETQSCPISSHFFRLRWLLYLGTLQRRNMGRPDSEHLG